MDASARHQGLMSTRLGALAIWGPARLWLFIPTLLGRGSSVPWFPALGNHLEPIHRAGVEVGGTSDVQRGRSPGYQATVREPAVRGE